jgi:hypothetical protein
VIRRALQRGRFLDLRFSQLSEMHSPRDVRSIMLGLSVLTHNAWFLPTIFVTPQPARLRHIEDVLGLAAGHAAHLHFPATIEDDRAWRVRVCLDKKIRLQCTRERPQLRSAATLRRRLPIALISASRNRFRRS